MHVQCRKSAVILLALPFEVQSWSAPPVDIFFRRRGHGIVVIGDYLYVQGGEISWDSGDGTSIGQAPNTTASRVNRTLAIPLAESWTNKTVKWVQTDISHQAPSLMYPALWPYGDSFFTWGGSTRFVPPETSMLWKFTADGAGEGNWTTSQPENPEAFGNIHRTAAAACATCHGVGLYLGGYVAPETDELFKDNTKAFPVPGLLTYDINTSKWSNETTKPGLNEYGTSLHAAATCLENYGRKGIFITIGGQIEANPWSYTDDGSLLIDTSVVSMYDIEANKWLKQKVSGQSPERRDRTCLGIAQGQNGSTDIYMYGGVQMASENRVNKVLDDIWLLSIPAFAWFKLNVTGTQRSSHDCVVVGSQLVSVGGMGSTSSFNEPDEWLQGLGVLDLTTMTWADRFNPNSAAYNPPQMVKDWYRDNELKNINWTSDDVKELFTSTTNPKITTNTTMTTDGTATATMTPNTNNQRIPIGSVIGITVGGIMALVVTSGIGFWCCRRQRSRNSKAVLAGDTTEEDQEGDQLPFTAGIYTQQWYYAEVNGCPELFQLPTEGSERVAELGPHADGHIPLERMRGIFELPGSSPAMKG